MTLTRYFVDESELRGEAEMACYESRIDSDTCVYRGHEVEALIEALRAQNHHMELIIAGHAKELEEERARLGWIVKDYRPLDLFNTLDGLTSTRYTLEQVRDAIDAQLGRKGAGSGDGFMRRPERSGQ